MKTSYRGKRAFDLMILALTTIPVVLVCVACAVAIKLTSKGPIFFRQERIGRDGVPFQLVKFRTMEVGDNPIFPDESCITCVGAVLRRLSLDELPQLFNVAKGEMSIVGPRPTLRYQVERYDDQQRRRLLVRPGLTGLAQVNGRNRLTWSDRIELDLDYVGCQSLRVDLKLILESVLAMLSGRDVEDHPIDDPIAEPPARS